MERSNHGAPVNGRAIRTIRNIRERTAHSWVPADKREDKGDDTSEDKRERRIGGGAVVFISERSEFKLIGNDHDRTALQNGCGPEQASGGDAELRMVREIVIGVQRT